MVRVAWHGPIRMEPRDKTGAAACWRLSRPQLARARHSLMTFSQGGGQCHSLTWVRVSNTSLGYRGAIVSPLSRRWDSGLGGRASHRWLHLIRIFFKGGDLLNDVRPSQNHLSPLLEKEQRRINRGKGDWITVRDLTFSKWQSAPNWINLRLKP